MATEVEKMPAAAPNEYSGTNTEKIDKIVATVIELRATLRLCYYLIGAGFPLVVLLMAFLVAKSYESSGKMDRLSDQLTYLQRDYDDIKHRMERMEAKKP